MSIVDTVKNNIAANLASADSAFFTLVTREISNNIIVESKVATCKKFDGVLYMAVYYNEHGADTWIKEKYETDIINESFIKRVTQYFVDEGFKNVKITKNTRDGVYDLSIVIHYSMSI